MTTAGAAEKRVREVLPAGVKPVHYELCLEPDLATCTFKGTCAVVVLVTSDTNTVVMNAHELKVQSVTVDASGITAQSFPVDDKLQTLTIKFNKPLPHGKSKIIIEYTGILNDKMCGFYASKYEKDGAQKTMAVTQFEACDARRALPCWDEPNLKATFGVRLIVDKALTSVSNMPESSCTDVGGGKVKRTYENTPIMSTYLLAFVIGEFDSLHQTTQDKVAVRVFTPVGAKAQGEFALEVAVKCLDFYNKYFEIKYPLPKLDLLAIPDFSAGAMEKSVEDCSLVVAHELAHQWFGNLVTMDWWTDLWLNEGFASWVEYLAVDYLFPAWKMWTQFISQDMCRALTLDALLSSHPVEVPVFKASEVDEIFDHISYCKGGSIIRMLVNYLGEEAFRKGMVSYLKKFAYGNASTKDLWNALGESSGKPVSSVMEKWTQTQGYPVVYVEEDAQHKGHILLRQERFLVDGPAKDYADQTWPVPITQVTGPSTSGAPPPLHLMTTKTYSLKCDVNAIPFLKLNANQCGVYRVKYSAPLMDRLIAAIKNGQLDVPADRLGIENDAIALARCGLVSTSQAMSLLLSYVNETNFTVWDDIVKNNLGEMKLLLMLHESIYTKFKLFACDVLRKVGTSVGWDAKPTDDHLTSLLRSLVIPKLGSYGDRDTIAEACKRFDAFVASGFKSRLIPDLRTGVYSIVLAERGKEAYDTLLKLYRTTTFQEEKVRVLSALGSAKDESLLKEALAFCFTPDVRKQDVMFVLGGVSVNPKGVELAWQWLQTNWDTIRDKFSSGFTLSRLVSYATKHFTSRDKAKEIQDFFAKNATPGAERAVQQSVETILSTATWLERDADGVKAWLDARFRVV
ncbi:unnamed protein product (mitochondrion) [Plasmodiophora brassicae]|uniref:Aminopeptidase n=1 Tax=Plasmodiophora brassicae TaxID=37360 RepID=A0A3P3YDL1_PLABS|nr:unnamed protein product [Plasmodiophora brassicae]